MSDVLKSPLPTPPASPPQRQPVVPAGAARVAGPAVVLVLIDVMPAHRWWGWLRLVLQGWPLRGVPGLRFHKVLGSGAGGGFGIRPSGTHGGLFLAFDDEDRARDFAEHSPLLARYRAHARELCVAVLRVTSSKGSWSGAALSVAAEAEPGLPVAALTRASIRPTRARAFWRHSPPSEAALAQAPGCLLAVGLGEAPVLRQATFSLWRSVADMEAYARSGAHLAAIKAAYGGGYFSETLFARFQPLSVRGRWQGRVHG